MTRLHCRGLTLALVAVTQMGCGSETPTSPGTVDPAAVNRAGSIRAQNAAPNLVVNTSPAADNSATPPRISGAAPLTVSFSLCNSTDSDAADGLNWQFHFGDSGQKPWNDDGTFNRDADQQCRVEHTYSEGAYTAWVSVTDRHLEDQGRGVSAMARKSQSFTIVVGKASDSPAPAATACQSGASRSYESADVPVTLQATGALESTLAVATDCSIAKVTASLYVTHPIDADLTVSLVGPDGNSVPLSVHRGGSGDDFGTSCGSRSGFDDSAAPPISAGVAPFSGTFQPDSPLSAFDRRNQKGTWRLRIDNSQGSERGILNCWGIRITN